MTIDMRPSFIFGLLATLILALLGEGVCAARLCDKENLAVLYSGPEKEGIGMTEVESAPEGDDIPKALLDPSKLKGAKIAKTGTTLYGAQEWTLKNGVKVVVYPTDLQKDQILMTLTKQGGRSLIPTEDMPGFIDANAFLSFFDFFHMLTCGVSTFSRTVLDEMLSDKNVSVKPFINDLEHGINASSSVKDLEIAFQLLYLQFVDPRFDPEEWHYGVELIAHSLHNLMMQGGSKLQEQLVNTAYGNNPRRQMISADLLAKTDLATMEKNYRKLFADAAGATVVIVGDVNPETLKPLVEKYIGSLPKGEKATCWVNTGEDIVKGRHQSVSDVELEFDTLPKKSTLVLQLYSADIPFSYDKQASLEAISLILDMRYAESLPEEEFETYSMLDRRPREKAMIQVAFPCEPAQCEKLRDLAVKGLQDLAVNGPTDEEVNMAKMDILKNIQEYRESNDYWKSCLENYLVFGDNNDARYEAAVNGLSKELIQNTMREILAQDNFIELVMNAHTTNNN